MEAAYTPPSSYPAYVNARVEGDMVVLRVRTDGAHTCGEIRLTKDEWLRWLNDAQQLVT